jgi:cell division protein ZapA
MPTVSIEIGRRSFQLVCGEGQEAHLQELAAQVSGRVDELASSMGSNNDTLLLVTSALMMQDEINSRPTSGAPVATAAPTIQGISEEDNERNINVAVSDAVEAIAQYVESVADRIESA